MSTKPKQYSDVQDIAKALIARYGERAVTFASHQALRARERGDHRTMAAWRWIGGAVAEILRSEPDEKDPQV